MASSRSWLLVIFFDVGVDAIITVILFSLPALFGQDLNDFNLPFLKWSAIMLFPGGLMGVQGWKKKSP
ncbi:MAG: hypothetical protein KJ808_07385 [Acidobacteria bacterium]|nr:hypothetical protein [Acidobacteriota bacterium]MBU4307537.1 hypothetical protein [Acidobacteriota bacterium]MBU4405008.1 hypothetical protein [Acidobacteriota bacterium]MCG2810920.1 hypothetical protein [Candidatus Aminicenantes bacterium]